jgi:hypothetical protein
MDDSLHHPVKMASSSSSSPELVPVKQQDFLDQDPAIRGQRFVCLSFVSPEDALQRKDLFVLQKFLRGISADVKIMLDNLEEKFKDDGGDTNSTVAMVKSLRDRYDYMWGYDDLHAEYEFFKQQNSQMLETEFNELNQFRTSVRGIKVRGVYDSMPEAINRAQALRKFDDKFHVFIAEVGCWCPWSPNPEDIAETEYAETQLNTLVKKYKENQSKRDELYEARKKALFDQAMFTAPNIETVVEPDPETVVEPAPEPDPEAVVEEVEPTSTSTA